MGRGDSRRRRSRSRDAPVVERVGYQGGPIKGDNSTIFCASLVMDIKDKDIENVFEDAGFPVKSVFIPREYATGRNKGFAFVDLKEGRDVEDAVKKVDGTDVLGRRIACEVRQPRTPKGKGRGDGDEGESHRPRDKGDRDSHRDRDRGRGSRRERRRDSRRRDRRDSRRR